MIDETISTIEARIQRQQHLDDAQKRELLELLKHLKSEVDGLALTHEEAARSITAFAGVSAQEATREHKNPELHQLSIQGLNASAAEFKNSHPRLVEVVNTISRMLSNLGI